MNNKERKFKEVIQGQERELKTDQVWSGIADRLPQKDNRKFGLLWLLLLIPLGIGAFYVLKNQSQDIIEYAEENASRPELVKNKLGFPGTKKGFEPDINEGKLGSRNNDEAIAEQETSAITHDNLQTKATILIKMASNAGPLISQNTELPLTNERPSIVSFDTINRNQENEELAGVGENEMEKTSDIREADKEAAVELNHFAPLETSLYTVSIDNQEQKIDKQRLVITSQHKNSRFGITVAAGINRSYDLLESLDSYETGLYGMSLSTGVEYYTRKRWTWKVGLGYNKYISRYQNNKEEVVEGSVPGITEIQIDALGKETSSTGTVKEITITQNDIEWHRRHQALDLELLFRRNVAISTRWKAGVDAGIGYNLYTGSAGYGYEVNEGVQTIVKFVSDPGYFRTRSGWKPMVGAEIAYRLSNVEILMKGDYQWNLAPINRETTIYQIKHSQTGIQLGMRYYLNGNKN